MTVLALPPSEFCSSIVSTESLYGTRICFLALAGSPLWASAEMTLPSDVSDRLIAAPSLSLSPVAPVESARSEPAKSTRLMSDERSVALPAARSTVVTVSWIEKIVCARLLVAFIAVLATVRACDPESSIFCSIRSSPTTHLDRPST